MIMDLPTVDRSGFVASENERQPLLPVDHLYAGEALDDTGVFNQQDRHRGARNNLSPSSLSITNFRSQDGPFSNVWRICATMLSFLFVGMHAATVGVLLPYFESYYSLNDTMVSLLFLTPVVGYLAASLMNSPIHIKLGPRGIAIIGPACHILQFSILSRHPPYLLMLLFFTIGGFGTGLVDGAWCAWAGGGPNPNAVQGLLHGSFSIGATVGPWVATSIVANANLPWYTYYYIMTVASVLELCSLAWAFRRDDGIQYCSDKAHDSLDQSSRMRAVLRTKVTWICAVYFLAYVGTETAISGWLVTFMLRVRSASPRVSGMCASGFWAGQAFGRISLGVVTERFGGQSLVTVYLVLAIATEAVFWLVSHIAVSVVTIILLGFFLGPLYPAGIVTLTRLLPRDLHISSVAFVATIGQMGGACFPFALGAIAQGWGVQVFQPIIFGSLLLVLVTWLLFPETQEQQEEVQSYEG